MKLLAQIAAFDVFNERRPEYDSPCDVSGPKSYCALFRVGGAPLALHIAAAIRRANNVCPIDI